MLGTIYDIIVHSQDNIKEYIQRRKSLRINKTISFKSSSKLKEVRNLNRNGRTNTKERTQNLKNNKTI